MKSTLKQLKQIDVRRLLPIALSVATVFLGLLYIWEVNMAATAGFELRDLEQSIYTLEQDGKSLDARVASLRSIDSVTTRMDMLGLKPVSRIEYLVPGGSNVAINRQYGSSDGSGIDDENISDGYDIEVRGGEDD